MQLVKIDLKGHVSPPAIVKHIAEVNKKYLVVYRMSCTDSLENSDTSILHVHQTSNKSKLGVLAGMFDFDIDEYVIDEMYEIVR